MPIKRKPRKPVRRSPRNTLPKEKKTIERGAKDVLFVQGGGAGTHDAWDNKLVDSLSEALGSGYTLRYPRMPNEANPDPAAWKRVITREIRKLSDGVVLVGHSIGAAILLEAVADADVKPPRLSGVFLVATPFLGDGGWPSDDLRPTNEVVDDLPDGVPLHLYRGSEDETVPDAHLELFQKELPRAAIHRLEGRDHQLNDNLAEVARDIRRLE